MAHTDPVVRPQGIKSIVKPKTLEELAEADTLAAIRPDLVGDDPEIVRAQITDRAASALASLLRVSGPRPRINDVMDRLRVRRAMGLPDRWQ